MARARIRTDVDALLREGAKRLGAEGLVTLLAAAARGESTHRDPLLSRLGPIDPDLVGRAYELAASPHDRRDGGAFFTPRELVDALVAEALDALGSSPERVLDPACGGGAFLLGLARACPSALLHGIDRDGGAVRACRVALALEAARRAPARIVDGLEARIVETDALLDDAPFGDRSGGFDLVVGNPPWLDAEWMVKHRATERARLSGRYVSTKGAWDLAVPFVERALQLVRPGGVVALLVPGRLASASFASALRAHVSSVAEVVRVVDFTGAKWFTAHVYPVGLVLRRRAEAGPADSSAWRIGGGDALLEALADGARPLGGIATITGAATVREAYAIAPLLTDGDEPGALRFVNTGLLDRHGHAWGTRPCRYLGRTYERPVVSRDRTPELPPNRLTQARSPKLVIAGLAKSLEAARDPDGTLLAGKTTTIVRCDDGRLLTALSGILQSSLAAAWFQRALPGDLLRGGHRRFGPPQLRPFPVRVHAGWVATLADLVQARERARGGARRRLDGDIDAACAELWELTGRLRAVALGEVASVDPALHETRDPCHPSVAPAAQSGAVTASERTHLHE